VRNLAANIQNYSNDFDNQYEPWCVFSKGLAGKYEENSEIDQEYAWSKKRRMDSMVR